MKVAVWHGIQRGGGRIAMDKLIAPLAKRHEIHQFVLGEAQPSDTQTDIETELVRFESRPPIRAGAHLNDLLTYLDLLDFEHREAELAAELDAAGFDVILTSALPFGQAPTLLSCARTPTAYFCHEVLRRFYEPWCRPDFRFMTRRETIRHIWRWPTQAVIDRHVRRQDVRNVQNATLVLTESEYVKRRIQAIYGRDAEVCSLGVEPDVFRPKRSGRPRNGVISTGALEPHKGFEFVINALATIDSAKRPRLTIAAGSGLPAMPAFLRSLAQTRGVDLDLRINLTHDELAALYENHELFVFGAYYEPFGLAVLEAMASELPVVAVLEGGVTESVVSGKTGLLVPREEAAFGAAVSRLLGDGVLRQQMGQAGRERSLGWSWTKATNQLESALDSLVYGTPSVHLRPS